MTNGERTYHVVSPPRGRYGVFALVRLTVLVFTPLTRAQTFLVAPSYPAGDQSHFVATADFNGDGKADLVTANADTVSILLNPGEGTFPSRVDYPTGPSVAAV